MGDTCGQIWGTKSATVRQQMHPKPVQGTEKGNRSAENASKMHTVCTKMHPEPVRGHQKCQPFVKKCVKMQTVRSKIVPREAWLRARRNICGAQIATVRTKMRQKCAPFGRNSMSNMQKWQPFVRKGVENAYPRAEIGFLRLTVLAQSWDSEGQVLNPLSLLLLDWR